MFLIFLDKKLVERFLFSSG